MRQDASVDGLIGDLHRLLLVSSRLLRSRTASDELSASQFSVLAYLHREGESSPSTVAEFERVSPPVMTRILSRLQAAGFVEREPHPQDGRQILVHLTPLGTERVSNGRRARDAWLRAHVEHLDPQQLHALAEATRLLSDTLIGQDRS